MEGGTLYRIEKRIGLVKHPSSFTVRRAVFAAILTWLPLFILSAIQGMAWGHKVPVSFLRDYSTYSRFLLAVPLFLLAENILAPRIAEAVAHFITSGLVKESDFQRFSDAIDEGMRSRDSVVAEIVMLVISYIITIVAFKTFAVTGSTWFANPGITGSSFTWAGWWLILVSTPVLQFLLLRWLWRLFLWFRFLGRVRRLDLQLFPTHPDESGGLGFVGEVQRFFGILLFAYSVASTGVLANEIVYEKIPLMHFVPAIITYVVIALSIILLPLAVFTRTLLVTKRLGLHKYGTLATEYTGAFHKRWIRKDDSGQEPLLGTGDIQSLADLGNSYAIIQRMDALPVNPRTLIHLLIATLLPITPLLLTVMPLKDVLKLLFKVLM